jgi:hypothetical protein
MTCHLVDQTHTFQDPNVETSDASAADRGDRVLRYRRTRSPARPPRGRNGVAQFGRRQRRPARPRLDRRDGELTLPDFQKGIADKLLGQVELVRQGIRHVAENGSFTLITGVLARQPVLTSAVPSLVNGALEAFVRSAAIELPGRRRINAVSPTIAAEAPDAARALFPGFLPTSIRDVAATYVRSIEGPQTGQIYELGN